MGASSAAIYVLLFVVAGQCLPAEALLEGVFVDNQWSLANLGGARGPGVGQAPFVEQRMNLLTLAGQAAEAVVKKSASSYVTTSASNKAPLGQTNSAGLLVYTPATSVLDAADFATFFQNSYSNASVKGIALTAGAYTCNNTEPSFHINLYCFSRPTNLNFELNFSGSTIYFGNYQLGGIGFFFCNDLYFHGPFNFMYFASALPFSQGTVKSITPLNDGSGNAVYQVATDAGYPTTTTGLGDGLGHLCAAYTASGVLIQNVTDIYTAPATLVAGTTGTYDFEANYEPNLKVGNKLAIRGNAGNHGIFFYEAVNLRAAYLYIYTAPIFGILDTFGRNSSFSNNIVQPWPYTIGSTLPLLSTNADGIHCASPLTIGPSIVSNQVINSGDDGIAVHGNYYTVYSNNPAQKQLIIFSPTCGSSFCLGPLFGPGDTIVVYSTPAAGLASSLSNLGTAVVAGVALLNPQPSGDGSASPTDHPGFPATGDNGDSIYPLQNYNSGFYYQLNLTSFPSAFSQATKDALIYDTITDGNGFKVNSNYVTNHRARSIHIKANNGVIENNVVENPNIYGMLLTPDLYFLEGDFQHNVTISNNYVSAPFANVWQTPQNPVDGTVLVEQNAANVTYSGNTFDNAASFAVSITSMHILKFTGNLIRNAGCYPQPYGEYEPFIPTRTLVYLAQITGLTNTGNQFTTNESCNTKYGNYNMPFYTSNVTTTTTG